MVNKKNKLKIGIDLDDVIVDTIKNFILFCEENNLEVKHSDFSSYYLCPEKGLDKAKRFELFTDFNNHSLSLDICFVEGAKNSLKKLHKKHDLFIVSSRPKRARVSSTKFIIDNFGEDFFKKIIYLENNLEDTATKTDLCKGMGISLLIEDRKKYSLCCAKNGIKVLLMDKPWNRDIEYHKNIIRVNNWKEIVEKIKGLTKNGHK